MIEGGPRCALLSGATWDGPQPNKSRHLLIGLKICVFLLCQPKRIFMGSLKSKRLSWESRWALEVQVCI